MIGAIGAEIDRLELEIRQTVPGIRHIDLVSHVLPSQAKLHKLAGLATHYVKHLNWVPPRFQLAMPEVLIA